MMHQRRNISVFGPILLTLAFRSKSIANVIKDVGECQPVYALDASTPIRVSKPTCSRLLPWSILKQRISLVTCLSLSVHRLRQRSPGLRPLACLATYRSKKKESRRHRLREDKEIPTIQDPWPKRRHSFPFPNQSFLGTQ